MISLIYGAKGTGKTARIMDAANAAAETVTGQVIFLSDNSQSLALNNKVRFINLREYDDDTMTEDEFSGFVYGMLATNFDIQKVYVDGLCRFMGIGAENLAHLFDRIKTAAKTVDFVFTVSAETLPENLKQYAK